MRKESCIIVKIFLTIGCLLICFAGCTGAGKAAPVLSMPPVSSAASAPVTAAASEPAAIAAQKGALPLENAYIAARADEIAAGLPCGEPVEEIRAAYCHIIENACCGSGPCARVVPEVQRCPARLRRQQRKGHCGQPAWRPPVPEDFAAALSRAAPAAHGISGPPFPV